MLPRMDKDAQSAEEALSILSEDKGELFPIRPSGRVTRRRLTRDQITQAFNDSFELIGGVSRLALWADSNPTEFYKLYARLLPSGSFEGLNTDREIVVVHVLPRTRLDEESSQEAIDGESCRE